MPRLLLIVAASENGVIGNQGALPWGHDLPGDLQHFKKVTSKMGTVVMGRKTAETLPKALPGRKNLVISRSGNTPLNKGFIEIWSPGCISHHVAPDGWCAVIGGSEIYRLFAPYCSAALVTQVHAEFDGDAFLPYDALDGFQPVSRNHVPADDANKYAYTIHRLQNRNPFPLPPRSK